MFSHTLKSTHPSRCLLAHLVHEPYKVHHARAVLVLLEHGMTSGIKGSWSSGFINHEIKWDDLQVARKSTTYPQNPANDVVDLRNDDLPCQ